MTIRQYKSLIIVINYVKDMQKDDSKIGKRFRTNEIKLSIFLRMLKNKNPVHYIDAKKPLEEEYKRRLKSNKIHWHFQTLEKARIIKHTQKRGYYTLPSNWKTFGYLEFVDNKLHISNNIDFIQKCLPILKEAYKPKEFDRIMGFLSKKIFMSKIVKTQHLSLKDQFRLHFKGLLIKYQTVKLDSESRQFLSDLAEKDKSNSIPEKYRIAFEWLEDYIKDPTFTTEDLGFRFPSNRQKNKKKLYMSGLLNIL